MSNVKFSIRNFALTLAVVCIGAFSVFAQKGDKKGDAPTEDINKNVRNVKPELKDAYKRWINNDVAYIITKDEKKAFYALATSAKILSKISGAVVILIPTLKKTSFAKNITNALRMPMSIMRPAYRDGKPTAAVFTSRGANPIR